MQPTDTLIAETVAHAPSFETEPIALYDALIEQLGETRATKIWVQACRIADHEGDDDD